MPDKSLLAVLDNHHIIAISDAHGKLIYSNRNFLKIVGASDDESINQTHQLLKATIHSKKLFWDVWKTILSGNEWKGVLYHKATATKTYILNTTITPIHNSEGDVIQYVTVCNDVSKFYPKTLDRGRSSCEENLWLESFSKDILYINKQGKIINTSEHALKESQDHIVGCCLFDFVNPINYDFVQNQIQKAFNQGKKGKYQSLGLSSKGNQTVYISKIKPVYNLNKEIIYATVKTKKQKDSTKTNTQLKAIETKYSNIFQSINVGIIVVANSVGNIIEWNKGAELAFGYTSSEIIGEPLTILISDKQVDTGIKAILKAKDNLDKDSYSENIEMLGQRKNGEEFPVEFAVSHWKNGKENFYCAFMLDITKRKALEAKLTKTSKDLELFLYRSAHDLKAPLTSAEGLLHLLKEENLDKNASQIVNMLDETLGKGMMLLDDLAFASVISEKRHDISAVDFQKVIGGIMTALKGLKNFRSAAFHIAIEQDVDFYFNTDLIDSILQNLIHNAVSFIKTKTATYMPTISVKIQVTSQDVNIIVKDNGFGISENHIDKVFDLYFRACSSKSQGAGLGLYIVKRIVDDFNGEASVTSEINKGTTFNVCLPNLKE
ncbi:PAS domain-containing protein [Bizionia myxarmorum]|nr:PAS domain S-box protein [Bizionia myxarmorum]